MSKLPRNKTKLGFIITVLSIFTIVSVCVSVKAQNPIDLEYSVMEMREEFSDKNEDWPYLTTMENLYVPDKDEYFMHRRNKSAAYAIITDWRNSLSEFNILTTLKLGPANDASQTIGVIFLVQDDGKGAVVVEFNKFKQYRVKQLVGSYYKFLSGETEDNGWVKSGALAGKNDYNAIDIRVNLPQVDVYLNDKFVESFDMIDYEPGGMGFLIGPDTKAKSDYFYVYTTESGKKTAEEEMKAEDDNQTAVEQLAKVRYDLEQEKRSLRECQMERKKAVTVLEEEMARFRSENEKLKIRNRQLQEFKNQVLVEVDEDVFLTLAENLKEEIIKNQKLEDQVQVYKDSLKYTHNKYSKLKLALLDKAIKKAEKEKVEREKKEAARTKEEIEQELRDKRLKQEQLEWEKNNPVSEVKDDSSNTEIEQKETLIEEALEAFDKEPDTSSAPNSSSKVSEEQIEARPLPVKTRKAQKKQD